MEDHNLIETEIKIIQIQNESLFFSVQINGKKNARMANESVKQAAATLKTAAEMIYQMDDTMTQKEENLCQRANDLRRTSEVTFKTIDKLK